MDQDQQDQDVNRIEHIPSYALPTMKLIALLRDSDEREIGATELMRIAGCDVSPSGPKPGYLASAVRHVRRQHARVWRWVRGEGKIRLLDSQERINLVEYRRRSQHRAASVSVQVLMTVDTEQLNTAQVAEYRTCMAMQAALVSISSSAMSKRLAAADDAVQTPTLTKLFESMIAPKE